MNAEQVLGDAAQASGLQRWTSVGWRCTSVGVATLNKRVCNAEQAFWNAAQACLQRWASALGGWSWQSRPLAKTLAPVQVEKLSAMRVGNPHGVVFIGKNKAKLSRIFFLPFFSVLRVFAPHAPQTQRIPERYIATTSLSPPRVASETLRGAYASLKLRYAKFSRPKLAKASPEGKPRMQPTCHNFGPPALRSKRREAPMLRQIFRSQNFRGATLEEEGSKGKPWKKKVPTTSREWSP